MSEEEKFANTIRALYYEEAISCVTEKGHMPYAQHVENGLFQIKESVNEKTQWSGTQTLITPKGRETFRLLCLKTA